MITRLVWTTWTPMSAVPKKAVKLNHSLTHYPIGLHLHVIYTHDTGIHYLGMVDNKSALVQAVSWCHDQQAQHLDQWWTRTITNSLYPRPSAPSILRLITCMFTCQGYSNKLDLELIRPVVANFWHPENSRNPYCAHGYTNVALMGKSP